MYKENILYYEYQKRCLSFSFYFEDENNITIPKLLPPNEVLKNDYEISFISGALIEITTMYIKNGKTDNLVMIEALLISLFEGRYLNTK